jgi:hypothetical protein
MQNDLAYLTFHIDLMKQSYNQLIQFIPFTHDPLSAEDAEFLTLYERTLEAMEQQEGAYSELGQELAGQWIRRYPELAPILPRDLLWFFGGECLHFMPDDEIQQFQALDERRYEAEAQGIKFEYAKERATALKLLH